MKTEARMVKKGSGRELLVQCTASGETVRSDNAVNALDSLAKCTAICREAKTTRKTT